MQRHHYHAVRLVELLRHVHLVRKRVLFETACALQRCVCVVASQLTICQQPLLVVEEVIEIHFVRRDYVLYRVGRVRPRAELGDRALHYEDTQCMLP